MWTTRSLGAALGAAGLLVLAATAPQVEAEMYRYADQRGNWHFTDNPLNVPDAYRGRLEKVELRERATGSAHKASGEGILNKSAMSLAQGQDFQPDFEAMEGFMKRWGPAYLIAALPWGLITLGTAYHAFRRQRFWWAIANLLLWMVSVPLYVLLRLELLSVPLRLAVLALWLSPFVVGALMFRAAIPLLTG